MAEMGAGEARKVETTAFEGVTPILRVASLAASIEHYVKVPGSSWIGRIRVLLRRFRGGIATSAVRGRSRACGRLGVDEGHVGMTVD